LLGFKLSCSPGEECSSRRIKVILLLLLAAGTVAQGQTPRKLDQGVDAKIYNGFRRYHAGCNHCHGPDGMGSTIGPSLVDRLPDIDAFRVIVRGGTGKGTSVMQGFADDPNVAPYIDDIYAYLKARADGTLGRGRPVRRE
jgi:mono/diheme cytochrome c family protein